MNKHTDAVIEVFRNQFNNVAWNPENKRRVEEFILQACLDAAREARREVIAEIKRFMKGKTIYKEKMRQYLNTLKEKPSPSEREPIFNWEGYEIDTDGNVYSCRVGYKETKRKREWAMLKQTLSKRGYYVITLRIGGKRKTANVHRLLAETFILNPDNKPHVLHKDGNPLNNSLSNLYWGTAKENHEDAVRHGVWWGNKKMKHCQKGKHED